MKHHTEDGRQFRSLGQAMRHAQDMNPDYPIYWLREDEANPDTNSTEDLEAYTGYTFPKYDDIGMQAVTTIIRK